MPFSDFVDQSAGGSAPPAGRGDTKLDEADSAECDIEEGVALEASVGVARGYKPALLGELRPRTARYVAEGRTVRVGERDDRR